MDVLEIFWCFSEMVSYKEQSFFAMQSPLLDASFELSESIFR